MKFSVTFKSPDGVDESLKEASLGPGTGIDPEDEDVEYLREQWIEKQKEFIERWVRYGEYVTVEFDTEAETATVAD